MASPEHLPVSTASLVPDAIAGSYKYSLVAER